jgi:hypothetical protein
MLKKIFPTLLLSISIVFMATSLSSSLQANACTSQGTGWTCEPNTSGPVMCINSGDASLNAACGALADCCYYPPAVY